MLPHGGRGPARHLKALKKVWHSEMHSGDPQVLHQFGYKVGSLNP